MNGDDVKRLVIKGLFQDDLLFQSLALKGGNALDLVYGISPRASNDIDLSLVADLPCSLGEFQARVEAALKGEFAAARLHVFDVRIEPKPDRELGEELGQFWGGYKIQFKAIGDEDWRRFGGDLPQLRRRAVPLAAGKATFPIDLSKHEGWREDFCELRELDSVAVQVYSLRLILFEKLRALCQQGEAYSKKVHKHRTPRARDYVDIWTICQAEDQSRLLSEDSRRILEATFEAKRVSLGLLRSLRSLGDFHAQNFSEVKSTLRPTFRLETFDFYREFVEGLAELLCETFGIVEPPSG